MRFNKIPNLSTHDNGAHTFWWRSIVNRKLCVAQAMSLIRNECLHHGIACLRCTIIYCNSRELSCVAAQRWYSHFLSVGLSQKKKKRKRWYEWCNLFFERIFIFDGTQFQQDKYFESTFQPNNREKKCNSYKSASGSFYSVCKNCVGISLKMLLSAGQTLSLGQQQLKHSWLNDETDP